MRWLLPVVVSILIALLYLTPQGRALRDSAMPWLVVPETGQPDAGEPAASSGDDDEEEEVPSRLRRVDGVLGIELTPETRRLSGVETQPAEAMQYREEFHALAEVISVTPLLELRTRYETLQSEIRVSEVQLQHSREVYNRLSVLHDDNANISARQLQEARAQMQADAARLAAQRQKLRSVREEAVQVWGETLSEWALPEQGNNGLFERLLNRQEVLLNLTLGRDQTLPATSRIIFVNRDDKRINARKAYLISPAPKTEPNLQGETYFFRTQADKLRVGMRVHAWIPVSGRIINGVYAPADAIVWQGGQPWIYLHDGEDFFYRRTLENAHKLSDGWFIPATEISEGELIVTTGAQMLLSEEYRWQIPDEDDDP